MMATTTTICHILNGNKILLKKATRGISKGKWNGAGGKIDSGETPEQSAVREIYEETGLKIKNLMYHGELKFFLNNSKELTVHNYLFSTKNFEGEIISTEEGEVAWFDIKDIPYPQMWPDDIYWMDLMLSGQKFDAEFYFNDDNSKIVTYNINIKG